MGYANLLLYVVVVAATALGLAAFNGQREHALERLQQREWQLNEAQRIGNLGVWVWDLDTDSFKLSDGALRILGSIQGQSSPSPESLLTRLIPEDRRAVEEMLLRVRQSCQRETCEARVRRDEDHLRHVTIACSAVINHRGQVTSLLGTLFDFTERKHYEDEQVRLQRRMLETQKLESLGMLASGIAHDFNNLLTGILGNSSLLRIQLPDGSPMAEGLRRIESSAERAADLCRQMLAYSGKGRFVVRTIDLNELARGTMVLAQTSMPRKAMLSLSPAATSPRIRADMMQLRQVVLNLLLNAAESLPEDGGKVDVRVGTLNVDKAWLASAYLAPDLPAAEYAFIEVSDTGCGIPSDLQQRIFEPFFTTKFTGRGLGLAAVAGIARAHRGAVRVASKAGEGSRFTVVLPFDTEPASASFAPPGPLLAGTARLPATAQPTGPLVLIVDDEETILQVASEYLTKNGLPTATATDGVQALERFGDGRDYRGVVLDYAMPRLDGLGTFKQMRQRRPDIPVLLTSGFEADEALERFAGLGITGFLQKPFTGAGLLAALRTALGQEAPPPPPDTPAGDI
jgi:signal transduction histidine kinase/CheY-like chemotaxis protein